MMCVPEVEALHPEFGRDGACRDAVALDLVERREEAGDISIRLLGAPAVARRAVELVKPQRWGLLDANGHVSASVPGDDLGRRQ